MRNCCKTLMLLAALGGGAPASAAEPAPLWIDVRSPVEYAAGDIRGATYIPFDVIDRRIGALVDSRDAPILLYCATGGRSAVALRVLTNMGYRNVRNAGGLREAEALLAP